MVQQFSGLNTNLEQQTGIQYEAGIKHNFDDVALVSVTPYWMVIDNEIFFDPTNGFSVPTATTTKPIARGLKWAVNLISTIS